MVHMAEVNTTSSVYAPGEPRSLVGVAVTGLAVGLIGWLVNMAIQSWIIEPIFCRSTQTFDVCSNGGTISWAIAMIIVSIIGLLSLVRSGVFRPLLVVLAVLIALWGASAWLGPLSWWEAMIWQGVIFAFAYSLFAWVARLQSFLLSLIVTIVLVILTRLVVINS